MIFALVASAVLLMGFLVYAWMTYTAAVVTGHREYAHVVYAATFVLILEWVALTSVKDDSFEAWVLLAANLFGIAAMWSLAKRFR